MQGPGAWLHYSSQPLRLGNNTSASSQGSCWERSMEPWAHLQLLLSWKATRSACKGISRLKPPSRSLPPLPPIFDLNSDFPTAVNHENNCRDPHVGAGSVRHENRSGQSGQLLTVQNSRAWWGRWTPWRRPRSAGRWLCSWKTRQVRTFLRNGLPQGATLHGPRTHARGPTARRTLPQTPHSFVNLVEWPSSPKCFVDG